MRVRLKLKTKTHRALTAFAATALAVTGVSAIGSESAFAANEPVITSATSANFAVGVAGTTFAPTATNTPTSWSETGTLPTGMSFSTTTGVFSGTPGAGMSAVYPVKLTATNANGSGTPQTLFINVWSAALTCGAWVSTTAPSSGVTAFTSSITGGGGGGGGYGGNSNSGDGGGAATLAATYTVTSLQKIWVNVGCGGAGGGTNNGSGGGGGGLAGTGSIAGGAGGNDFQTSTPDGAGGGGGGASVLCTGSAASCAAGTTLLIAGGGGGGGGNGCTGTAGDGGVAGGGATFTPGGFSGKAGGSGTASPNFAAGFGAGGTATGGTFGAAGSNGGSPAGNGVAGSNPTAGTGGKGGQENTSAAKDQGAGGGGGGYAGGGGGGASGCNSGAAGAGGGGAGSSVAATASSSNVTFASVSSTSNSCGSSGAIGSGLNGGNGGGGATSTATAWSGCAGNITLNWISTPTKLAFVQGPSNVGAGVSMTPAVTVQVQDAFGGATSASGVSITLTPSSSTISAGATAITGATGLATFSGLQFNALATGLTLTAAASGLTAAPASSAFNVTVGPATKVVFVQGPSDVQAGVSMSPAVTVQVQDQFGNAVASSGVTVNLTATGATIASGNSTTTSAAGLATFSAIKINTVATGATLTASSSGLTSSPASSTFNITAGPATKLAFVQQPSNVAAGVSMSPAPTVQVQDAGGNAVSGAGVSITLAPSSGTIAAGATASTNAAGLATFTGFQINTAATGLTLTGSSAGLTNTAASSSFNVTGGAASSVAFVQQPSNVTAGVNMAPSPTVSVQDQFGNPVSGASVTLAASSGSIASGFSGSTAANGQISFAALKINTAATGLTLTATSGAITSAASSPFNVTAAAANKLAYVQQPSVVSAGVAMTPAVTVQIQDQFGNAVASNNVLITLSASPGSIASGNTANTNASGLATFSAIVINTAGNQTLTAASTGLTSIASNSFTVTPGPANKLGFVQNPTNVVAGASITPAVTVQIQDQFGNAVPTSGVSITVAPSAGTIASGDTVTTNGSGLASFGAIKINIAATGLTLSASSTSPALTSGSSTSFNVTAGTQSKLVFLQGPSNVVAGVSMAPSVTVQAQDTFGNPVSTSGTTITLVPSSGVINSGNTANTASGVATFNAVKINTAATGLTLTATGPSLTAAPASSTFNVTAATATKLAIVQQPSNVQAGNAMTPAVTIQAQDPFSNPAPQAGISVTLTPNTGIINSGNQANTSAAGLATFSGITINAAATGVTLTAAASGLTSTPASSAFNITAAAANKLAFVQGPLDTTTGVAITPAVTVQVQDTFGNSVPGAGVNITLTPSIGPINSGGSVATAATGLSTFSAITINTANAGITLTASAPGPLTSLASASFTVAVLAANGAALTETATDAGSGVKTVSYYYCGGYIDSPVCTSSNGTLIGSSTTPAGNFPISWTGQPVNGSYRLVTVAVDNVTNTSAASAPIPVKVLNQVAQTINFTSTAPTAKTVGGTTYTVTATATSGLPVAFSLDASSTGCTIATATVSFTAAGTCVIDANQAGNALYTPAPQVQQTITVLAPLTVTSITSTSANTITPGTSSETITFNNALNPASVPATGVMTLSEGCIIVCSNTTLSIPGFTNGALDTGSNNKWVTYPGIGTRTVTYNVAFTLSGDHKSITLSVVSCVNCSNAAAGGPGLYKFIPVTSIVDIAGDSAPEYDTPSSFSIF